MHNALKNLEWQLRLFARIFSSVRASGFLWFSHVLSALVLTTTSGLLHAAPLLLTELPAGSLISHSSLLFENASSLNLEEAQARQIEGKFHSGTQSVLNSGIGSRPVWVHLALVNPTSQALPFRLMAGTTWIDHLDVYIIHDGKVSASWHTGDASPEAFGLTPAIGFSFSPLFEPGRSDLYLRAEAIDPLVLPLELIPENQSTSNDRLTHYSYGFFYGFLFALLAYNAMIFAGLGERSYLYYSLYLANLIMLSLAYTGHGYAWLWPSQPLFQSYVILVLMVLFGCSGLLFASRFLALAEHAPRVLRAVQLFALSGVGLLSLCIALDNQLGAALVAFSFATLFTVSMVLLGILTIWHRRPTGRYFLAASLCGMLGTASTTFAVWGWIPFTLLTYHALEIGIAFEATLLALVLTFQIRHYQQASLRAEHLSRLDHLTGLYNRRAFLDLSTQIWSTADRSLRSLSLIMLDIDHFKQINDQYGHETGDRALVAIARLLTQACRAGDIPVRWGGEEFMLLLPETDLAQACTLAERIRLSIETLRLPVSKDSITLTASFGVVQRNLHTSLEELIHEADKHLYEAKQNGRNQVSSARDMATHLYPA